MYIVPVVNAKESLLTESARNPRSEGLSRSRGRGHQAWRVSEKAFPLVLLNYQLQDKPRSKVCLQLKYPH